MKYFPIINLLSLILMAYWLFKDCKFKILFRKIKNKISDFFCPLFERISDDIEIY